MPEKVKGKLEIQDGTGSQTRMTLDGTSGINTIGGQGKNGVLNVRDKNGHTNVIFQAGVSAQLRLQEP